MEPTLRVSERGQTRWVTGETQQRAIVARPVDVQRLATDAMSANNDMVTAILRSMTPAIDADPGNRAQPGLSSPSELAARNERFRWTTAATVALSAVTAGGICWVAYLAGAVNEPGALAGWLTLSGLAGYASVQWTHHRESQLTAEAIELERVAGDYDVAATDAESRQLLARAYADAVRDDAAARRASAEAQRAANLQTLAPAQRQMDYTPREAPERRQWQDDAAAPITTPSQAAETPTAPDPVLAGVLEFLDRQHAAYVQTGRTLITERLPWSARGAMPQGDKERVDQALSHIVNPPIIVGAGNRLHWNRHQPWQRTRRLLVENWR